MARQLRHRRAGIEETLPQHFPVPPGHDADRIGSQVACARFAGPNCWSQDKLDG
jgi:hypothetical protein